MSTDNTNCFEGVVGFTRTECPCEAPFPLGYTDSKSGLYVDELEGMALDKAKAGANCNTGSLWDFAAKAISNATSQFQVDLNNALSALTKKAILTFKGVIGNAEPLKQVPMQNGKYAGVGMIARRAKGLRISLDKIVLKFAYTGTLRVNLVDLTSGELIEEYDIPVTSGRVTTFPLPVPFDLTQEDEYFRFRTYGLVAETSSVIKPHETYVSCGCGDWKLFNQWNTEAPDFKVHSTQMTNEWTSSLIVKGIQGSDPLDVSTMTTDEKTYGILPVVSIICANEIGWCDSDVDWTRDEIPAAAAYAIRYLAAYNLYSSLLASSASNPVLARDREYVYGQRNHYQKEYNNYIAFLADELSKPENINRYSDCYNCSPALGMRKRGILVTR